MNDENFQNFKIEFEIRKITSKRQCTWHYGKWQYPFLLQIHNLFTTLSIEKCSRIRSFSRRWLFIVVYKGSSPSDWARVSADMSGPGLKSRQKSCRAIVHDFCRAQNHAQNKFWPTRLILPSNIIWGLYESFTISVVISNLGPDIRKKTADVTKLKNGFKNNVNAKCETGGNFELNNV